MNKQPLTPTQRDRLEWIKNSLLEGRSPTIREMQFAWNLRSPAPVQSTLSYLREKGYLDWDDYQARSIKLTGMRSPREIQQENEELKKRIEELENQLRAIA